MDSRWTGGVVESKTTTPARCDREDESVAAELDERDAHCQNGRRVDDSSKARLHGLGNRHVFPFCSSTTPDAPDVTHQVLQGGTASVREHQCAQMQREACIEGSGTR